MALALMAVAMFGTFISQAVCKEGQAHFDESSACHVHCDPGLKANLSKAYCEIRKGGTICEWLRHGGDDPHVYAIECSGTPLPTPEPSPKPMPKPTPKPSPPPTPVGPTPKPTPGPLPAPTPPPGPSDVPTDDPVAAMYGDAYSWASTMVNWANVFDVSDYNFNFDRAQDAAVKVGGGVIFFPAGTYDFSSNIQLKSNVVIRGVPDTRAAKNGKAVGKLAPKTVFRCPDKSHLGILNYDANAQNLGIVNVDLQGCAVMLWPKLTPEPLSMKDYWYHATEVEGMGSNKLVLGCRVRDVSLDNPDPSLTSANGAVWPWRFSTSIAVYSDQDALVANNLVAKADASSITDVAGFAGVPYPYDNRYGIDVNQVLLGGVVGKTSGGPCKANPQNSPYYFRKGLAIRDNYVFQNGRVGISWSGGDNGSTIGGGSQVVNNHVEVAQGTTCYSVSGKKETSGHDTNENRGYNQQGYGTNFTGNSAHVYRQKAGSSSYLTVDGEGLLHQCSAGNEAYRNIWRNNDFTGGSDGYMGFYGLGTVVDNIVEGNRVNSNEKIGIICGGSSPAKMTISGNKCSGNSPKAICVDPRAVVV